MTEREQLGRTIASLEAQHPNPLSKCSRSFPLFVVAVRAGVSYLSTKIGGEKVNLAAELALTVVRALEQQGELLGFDGARKKEMAIVMLRQLCRLISTGAATVPVGDTLRSS